MRLEEAIFSSPTGRAAHVSCLNSRQPWIVSRDNLVQYGVVWRSTGQVAVDVKYPIQKQLRISQYWEALEHFSFEIPALPNVGSASPSSQNDLACRLELIQQHVTQENENRQSPLLAAALNELRFVIRAAKGQPVFGKRPSDKDFEPRGGVEITGQHGGRCIR